MSGRILILAALLIALFAAGPASAQVANGYTGSGSSGGGVSSVSAVAPILSSGGTTPSISLSLGTAGQFITTNAAASAATWVSCSGDVACATATPGQLNISKIAGLAGGTVTLGDGVHDVTFAGLAATSGAGQNIQLTPSAATTTGANGNVFVNVAAPASGTVEGRLAFVRGGTETVAIQNIVGSSSSGGLYMGLGATAKTATNFTILAQSNGLVELNAFGGCTSLGTCMTWLAGGSPIGGWTLGGLSLGTAGVLRTGTSSGNNEIGLTDQSSADVAAIAGGTKVMSIAGVLTSVGPGGFQVQMGLTGGGSHSTQARQITQQADQLTVTHSSGAVTISTVPLATSATHGHYTIVAECRATTLFTGGAVGDGWSATADVLVKNIGGVLTQVGTTTSVATHNDTVLTNALSVTTSSTNVLVQITPPTLAAGIEDCTSYVEGLVN